MTVGVDTLEEVREAVLSTARSLPAGGDRSVCLRPPKLGSPNGRWMKAMNDAMAEAEVIPTRLDYLAGCLFVSIIKKPKSVH